MSRPDATCRLLRVSGALLVATMLLSRAAEAQADSPFDVGRREFSASRYASALKAFEQSYREGSHRVVLLWLGETCRALHWNGTGTMEQREKLRTRAVEYLELYARGISGDPYSSPDEQENAKEARAIIARLGIEIPPWKTPAALERAAIEDDRSVLYFHSSYELWRKGTGVTYGFVVQPFAFLERRIHFGLSGLEQVTGSGSTGRVETIGGFVGYQWWPNKYLVPYTRLHVQWSPATRSQVWLGEGGVTVYPGILGYFTAGAGYSSLFGPEFSIGFGIHWALTLLVAANLH